MERLVPGCGRRDSAPSVVNDGLNRGEAAEQRPDVHDRER